MGQSFLGCDRAQELLLPPSLREWLPEDHLAWFVIDAVAAMDLDAFYAAYRVDGHGRAAHEPAMMVALLLYAYATGERSSRRIERRCSDDVATRVICANQRPITPRSRGSASATRPRWAACSARSSSSAPMPAWSGSGWWRSTAPRSTRTRRTTRLGPTKGLRARSSPRPTPSMPRRTSSSARGAATSCRASWPRRRAGAAGCATRAGAWTSAAPRRPGRSRSPAPTGSKRPSGASRKSTPSSAAPTPTTRPTGRAASTRTAAASVGRRTRSRRPKHRAGRSNVSDPDSRNVKTTRGWIQGYNAQAAVTEDQIVVAAEVTVDSPDFGHLEPMVNATRCELAAAGIQEPPETVLADSGYWHHVQMDRAAADGLQLLIPPDAGKRSGTRPGWDGGRYDFMRSVLATEHGGDLYRRRQTMIEPVFGHTKFNRRMDRFLRRGRAAARSEWRLITATHNMVKLWRHTTATAAA